MDDVEQYYGTYMAVSAASNWPDDGSCLAETSYTKIIYYTKRDKLLLIAVINLCVFLTTRCPT
jgi:hypothetical protein